MLILIAGATGTIGQHLIDSALSRSHRVRVLARSPSKLPPTTLAQLEGTVESASYHDIAALDRACAGVDAVICAYTGTPELQLEGNLLLLRAAERAGTVRVFVPATWNYDWTKLALGEQESYDAYIAFSNHAATSSRLNPVYIFTGVFAEILFAMPGRAHWSSENHGCWDPKGKCADVWGTGREVWHWTTERDAAEFTVEIVGHASAEKGGYWYVYSGAGSLLDIVAAYERVRGVRVEMRRKGTVEELREKALAARAAGDKRSYWEYIGWFYHLYTIDGTWKLERDDRPLIPGAQPTRLEDWLKENPDVSSGA